MTSFPNQTPPPSYDPMIGYAQPLKDRPTSVTVLAIIGIIWAIISLLFGAYGLITSMLMASGRTMFGPSALKLPHPLVVVSIVQGVIGLGLPTISMGLLAVVMPPVHAAAILILPSLITNVRQMLAGPALSAVLRRLWPMLLAVCLGTWAGLGLMTATTARFGTALLASG